MSRLWEATRLVALLFGAVYHPVWAVWSFFGPPNHTIIALIALSYTALSIECWDWVERQPPPPRI